MADVITHNIDKVVDRLTTFQRTALPKAARRTVNQLGFDLARRDVPQYMREVFDRPNKFTQRSLTYKVVSNYEVQLTFKQNVGKGNDPARYLYPVTKGLPGNEAYQTKFTRYIHKAGIAPRNLYPVPFKENLSKNSYGKVSQGEYSKVWSGLQTTKGAGKTGRGFRYFSKPDNRNRSRVSTRQGSLFDLPDGIYRVKGRGASGIQLLFTYARKKPTVPKIFDYYGFVQKNIRFRIGPMLSQNLKAFS
tara:strand:- start:1029 stop:1769 length:741 start_codon:yes stop_codon:yes gene_type:complete